MQTVDNLSYQFQRLIKEYKVIKDAQKKGDLTKEQIAEQIKKIASEIRDILSPLVIRRSRLDLKAIEEYAEDLRRQNISFPKVNDPKLLEYELKELSFLYRETLNEIAPEDETKGFIGARYKPTNYIKDFEKYRERIAKEMGVDENLLKQTQLNLAKFMRRLLVRRFESSVKAFETTLDSIIQSSQIILDWYEKLAKVPIYKKGKLPDVDSLMESTGEDLDEELRESTLEEELKEYQEKGLWLIDSKEIRKAFADDIKKDIQLLTSIKARWFGKGFPKDYKLERFAEVLKEKLKEAPNRKIAVFTEFADTANYLHDKLKHNLRVFKYTSEDATKANQNIINENFDAASEVQKNDYDVLIATDAISEGFNLHRAGIIFNYDIPYNPTRVIQRVGRINRINKKVFDELFIYNFFPTATGEKETRVKQISTLKLAMVHALFGEDTKVLTKDEELQSFFAEQVRQLFDSQEEPSPDAKYENYIRKLRESNPDIIEESLNVSRRVRIRRSAKKDRKGILVFGKKGEEFAFKFGKSSEEIFTLGYFEAFRLFEAELSEKPEKPSEHFDELYEKVKRILFSKRSEVAKDRGKAETILKVEALRSKLPDKKDYLDDLYYVLKNLDALPERYAKNIRAIDLKNLDVEFSDLERDVPAGYLLAILDKEKQIDEGKEVLILSEELI